MPIQINGSGTITGISTGGLPDGVVDTDTLAASAVTNAKIASGNGGQVLQVVNNQTDSTGSLQLSNGGDVSFTYLSVNITPISSNSTIYISYHLPGEMNINGAVYNSMMYIRRSASGIDTYLRPAASGSRNRGMIQLTSGYADFNQFTTIEQWTMTNYPDTHGVTAGTQITYFPVIDNRGGAATWYYNRTAQDSDAGTSERGRSWILAMEVA